MPHPFPTPSHDWPGAALVRQIQQKRQRRQANQRLADALERDFADEHKARLIAQAIQQGADPNHALGGNTPLRPLEWAVAQRRFSLVITLLDAGAKPTMNIPHRLPAPSLDVLYKTPLQLGAFASTVQALAETLAHRVFEWTSPEEILRAIDALLERGANPWRVGETNDPKGAVTTPLHLLAFEHASLKGLPSAVLHRLDPSRQDVYGNTAAHVVAQHGNGLSHVLETPDVIQGLIALAGVGAGLDDVRNQNGCSVLDLLVQRIPTDVPPTALSALRSAVPALRWDLRPPQGGPSPLERLQALTFDPASPVAMERVQASWLREFLDEEEHRLLTRAAETVTPDEAPLLRSRSRL